MLGNGGVSRSHAGLVSGRKGTVGEGTKRRKKGRTKSGQKPCPSFPCFFVEFLGFFSLATISLFFERFSLLSRDFGGSVGTKNPCFFGGFPCCFPKKKEKKDRELSSSEKSKSGVIIQGPFWEQNKPL